jgi:PAS domain S-box-containing protein
MMIVSKTDARGIISFGNDNFVKVSGYPETELIGTPHNILRHPDMPKAIFYLMWQKIQRGKNIMAIVKNLSKNGDYYWVTTDFEIRRDRDRKIQSYLAFRQAAPRYVVKEIESLYTIMLDIEEKLGMDESLLYLEGYLDERGMSYEEYIQSLVAPKGLSETLFVKMRDIFGS